MNDLPPEKKVPPQKEENLLKCPLCGFSFKEGLKTACYQCPLNYEKCHFEKCPHCGYDIPCASVLWTAVETLWMKMKQPPKGA
ncbi:MAG: hypothetical protein A3G91_00155 [Omnitrophica WOR_2 bacterium RIFCSPLOWO2_12_FULL_50_9]|nr:MAG: hypothetical protein A3D87_05765 [Omnitrophica WOR_2 bacterium RIFCSPHIGHO2_02_FULL_50_17]OGX42274.1 MAG: hypothetical protein A3G91_00155 [Omnitrophica WOR_2 bacterium RIFCSPLOWO2_12_FULL_50_9]